MQTTIPAMLNGTHDGFMFSSARSPYPEPEKEKKVIYDVSFSDFFYKHFKLQDIHVIVYINLDSRIFVIGIYFFSVD